MSAGRICRASLGFSGSLSGLPGWQRRKEGDMAPQAQAAGDRTQAQRFCFVPPRDCFLPGRGVGEGKSISSSPPPHPPGTHARDSLDHVGSVKRSHSCGLPLGLLRTFHTP